MLDLGPRKGAGRLRRVGSVAPVGAGHWTASAGVRSVGAREWAAWGAPIGLEEAPKGLAGDEIEGGVEFHGGGHGGRRRSKKQWGGDANLRGGGWDQF
jgi:hypothetical protein